MICFVCIPHILSSILVIMISQKFCNFALISLCLENWSIGNCKISRPVFGFVIVATSSFASLWLENLFYIISPFRNELKLFCDL